MAIYNTYPVIYEGWQAQAIADNENLDHQHQGAILFANRQVAGWIDYDPETQSITFADFIGNVDGIDVYYDYCGDYYFFCDGTV